MENARAVRIEPAVETLSPSPVRCFPVGPARDTRYTLYVDGEGGTPVSQSLVVRVRARPARQTPSASQERLITLFAAAASEVAAGQAVTVCYGVRNATSVRLEPGARALEPAERRCLSLQPAATTTYSLVVSGAGGRTDREDLLIQVK